MQDRYSLAPARLRAVRLLALVFLLLALHRTATLALPLTAPAYMGMQFELGGDWRVEPDPFVILPPERRAGAAATPGARARFDARLDDRGVRWRLLLIELISRIPELAMMYCVGIGLWRSSRPGVDAGLSGLPWLSRAAIAGVALALLTPVADALRSGLLLTGVVPVATFDLYIDLDVLQRHLLFAAAALAATWTIGAGLRARAELADIV